MKLFRLHPVTGRRLLQKKRATLEEALEWIKEDELNVAVDKDGNYLEEELENAESIRSETRTREDSESAGSGPVFEDTDRELPEADTDNTESSSERDN